MGVSWAWYCRGADGSIWYHPSLDRLWDFIESVGGPLYPSWQAPAGLIGQPVPRTGAPWTVPYEGI